MKDKCSFRSTAFTLHVVLCSALVCATAISLQANTITVMNTNDSGSGSLRQALADANDGDTIDVTVIGAIALTSGELLVDKSVTIFGPGAATLAVNGNAMSRVFHIASGKTVSISGLTLTNGAATSENGGGILNDHAILTMDGCAVLNSGSNLGGGIYNDGSGGRAALTIINTTVTNNGVGFADFFPPGSEGGGVYNGVGIMMITNSSVSGNFAGVPGPNFPTGVGGGISNYGTLTITNSTINGNQCWYYAGGISNSGTLTITNSTVSGNRATGQHDGEPWGNRWRYRRRSNVN